MTKVELKVIQTAMRATRDLIKALNDGKEMPGQLEKMFYGMNEYSIILSEMIDKEDDKCLKNEDAFSIKSAKP